MARKAETVTMIERKLAELEAAKEKRNSTLIENEEGVEVNQRISYQQLDILPNQSKNLNQETINQHQEVSKNFKKTDLDELSMEELERLRSQGKVKMKLVEGKLKLVWV